MAFIRKFIGVFAMVATTGCYTMRPVRLDESPAAAIRPESIEVMTKAGVHVRIYEPAVRGDSLHGWYDEQKTRFASYSIDEIATAEVRQLSAGRTAALVVGGGAAAIGVVYLVLLYTVLHGLGAM
jgi:hypothetical protein